MSRQPDCYLESGRAQEVLKGLPSGSARLFNFSPPYVGNVDYAESAEAGDNRYAWNNLANDDRVPNGHPDATGESEPEGPTPEEVSEYTSEHLQTCKQIERVGADTSVICVEIDDVRVNGEYRLVGLVSIWERMLESIGYRIAEKITLGRKIAVSRRGAHLMRDEDRYRRPGYYAPANVTSTFLVAFRGAVQERLRRDGTEEQEGFSKEFAKSHMKNLWKLQPPGEDRMDREGHPCPQSLRVARAAIRFYSVQDDLVVDPYAGVGTTGQAALEEGRRAALIERENAFCRRARQKLKAATGRSPRRIGEQSSVVIPGEQLRLPMLRGEERDKVRNVAYPGDGGPTDRHREMAREMSEMIGRDVPPSLVSVFLRGERGYYNA
jgi:DNA modification methylase